MRSRGSHPGRGVELLASEITNETLGQTATIMQWTVRRGVGAVFGITDPLAGTR